MTLSDILMGAAAYLSEQGAAALDSAAADQSSPLARTVLGLLAATVREQGPDAAATLADHIRRALEGESPNDVVLLWGRLDGDAWTALQRESQAAEAEAKVAASNAARAAGAILRSVAENVALGALGAG